MARVALEIPKVGLVMEKARLVRWLKHVGETVQQGEPLLELETEKSVVEIEATHSGRLVEILLQADQEASVGDRVGWLEVEAGAAVAASAGADVPTSSRAHGVVGVPTSGRADGADVRPSGSSPRIRSSPVARRLASENALDLRGVVGTGPRGRVQLADVRRALADNGAAAAGARPAVASGLASGLASRVASGHAATARGDRQALSSMRRALARSMTLSNATIPQFNVERAVDWTALQATRARLAAELPAGTLCPSVTDFLLQAIARTLLAFPALNATFTGDADSPDANIIPASGTHIGLVVAVENGLLVPVLHNVEKLDLAELAQRRADTVDRALQGKLKRDELEGATFSLSNLGARGPDRFTAIINPPQSAILAVGRQRDCVVASEGQVRIVPMSQLTLTVDHRIADGRLAADFLAHLTELLETLQ